MAETDIQKDQAAQAGETIAPDEFASLLQQEFKPKTERTREAVADAVQTLAEQVLKESGVVSDDAVATIEGIIAEIDKKLTEQINLILHHEGSINGVNGATWNGEESRILTWSFDGAIRIWDAATGKNLFTFSHKDSVNGAAWNRDKSRILTWSFDDTAKVWDAATGELLFSLPSDGHFIKIALWNRDESRILLGTAGGFLRVYYTHTLELAEQACQYTTRNFNWEEWQLYFPGQPYERTCSQWPVHPTVPQG